MPSFMNTLGARPRASQWRFRHVFRVSDAGGRLDVTDAGLLDFGGCSEILLTVTPRDPRHRCRDGWGWCGSPEPVPVLTAALSTGTLDASNPGILEAVFPAGSLLAFPPGLYDARVIVTIGPETEEIFREPIEFA
jgi:hypothetical protein